MMGEEDITLELLAEKSADHMAWDQPVKFKGRCLIGCKGRKMLTTKNMVTALGWVDYHREGAEHVANQLQKYKTSGVVPEQIGGRVVFNSSNGEETQP